MPLAVTVKVAFCPAVTVVSTGCWVILRDDELTVKVAELLVTEPPTDAVTTQRNVAPLSARVVAGVV